MTGFPAAAAPGMQRRQAGRVRHPVRAILLLLLLALPACSRPPAPPASPLARAALAEWALWGNVVVEGWPDLRPTDTAATDVRFNRLLEYWRAVPGRERVVQRHLRVREGLLSPFTEEEGEVTADSLMAAAVPTPAEHRPGTEDIGIYAYPAWSAAFITAVARLAGLSEAVLPSTDRHAAYIDAILQRWLNERNEAPFAPFAPEERVPEAGDLICADRAALPMSHWSDRLAETGMPRPMHCDVVVGRRPGVVEAVGGNVSDLVVLRRFPADAEGHLLPAPFGRPVLLLVLAARR